VKKYVNEWLSGEFEKDVPQWDPRKLTNDAGVYLIFKDNHRKKAKFGTGRDCKTRVKDQEHKWAFTMMNEDEMKAFVPQALVKLIKFLGLPGLVYHTDHADHLETLIRMQLCEMYLATVYECITNTVGERFIEVPSKRVLESLRVQTISKEAIGFMTDIRIPRNGVHFVLTWPTMRSVLQELKSEDSFLEHLQDVPEGGGFIKIYLLQQLFGVLAGGWENCITTSPREVQLLDVVARIEAAITSGDKEGLRSALKSIQDEDYDHYVPPSSCDLAAVAHTVVSKQMASLPTNHVIMMERETFNDLKEHQPDWFAENIDMSTAIEVMPDEALFLVKTITSGHTSGHRIMVMSSSFRMYSENTKTETRFKATKEYLTCLRLLSECKYVTPHEVSQLEKICCTFLMRVEGFNDKRPSKGAKPQPSESPSLERPSKRAKPHETKVDDDIGNKAPANDDGSGKTPDGFKDALEQPAVAKRARDEVEEPPSKRAKPHETKVDEDISKKPLANNDNDDGSGNRKRKRSEEQCRQLKYGTYISLYW
jgi:hypothetical protein